jgi:hypothetical protein
MGDITMYPSAAETPVAITGLTAREASWKGRTLGDVAELVR